MSTAMKITPVNSTVAEANDAHANRDPITGEPGSHPVATTIGAAVGVTAGVATAVAIGATAGAALGPAGAAIGAVVGGIFGGGVGHAVGEDIFPTQLAWWKDNFANRPYVTQGARFDSYQPAYWYGIDASIKNQDQDFDTLEPSLKNNWNLARGDSSLEWNDAMPAARDAFTRMRSSSK